MTKNVFSDEEYNPKETENRSNLKLSFVTEAQRKEIEEKAKKNVKDVAENLAKLQKRDPKKKGSEPWI